MVPMKLALQGDNCIACLRSTPCSACSVHRAFTGALASASQHSASTVAAATAAARFELLHSLPARLRCALKAEHLEAAVAEVAQLRARQVKAQMDAARLRIAALQRQLRWDRVEALVASRLAPQLCNALSLSKAGQVRLLYPVAAFAIDTSASISCACCLYCSD